MLGPADLLLTELSGVAWTCLAIRIVAETIGARRTGCGSERTSGGCLVVSEAWGILLITARWWGNAQARSSKVALQRFPFWDTSVHARTLTLTYPNPGTWLDLA